MPELMIGNVNEFFSRLIVAGVELFDSVEIGKQPVRQAGAGDSVGIKVPARVRKGDIVYKVAG